LQSPNHQLLLKWKQHLNLLVYDAQATSEIPACVMPIMLEDMNGKPMPKEQKFNN
jgi:hypothetical protein